ncbi:MAG: hypothetical protein ACOYUB_04620 [Patescibacteria group bacterium]
MNKSNEIITKSDTNPAQNQDELSPKMSNNVQVRKKYQYRQFVRLIRAGKFTTALATAKVIGVDRRTIVAWLKSNKVKLAVGEEIDSLVQKIKGAKDWHSKAYLLDKILEETKEKAPEIEILEGLTIIRQNNNENIN